MRIIAEIGVNHDGNLAKALDLVKASAEAGATHVKFQYFQAEELVAPDASLVDYQKRSTSGTQLQMLKGLEMSKSDLERCFDLARNMGVVPFATAFSPQLVDDLAQLGQRVFKVPSGEITNFMLMERLQEVAEEIVLSTGMSSMAEVATALEFFCNQGFNRHAITVLHCTSAYPAPYESLNLRAIEALAIGLRVRIGYSDHSSSNTASVISLALGADTFEKHITLSKGDSGPDHAASLEPSEFRQYVQVLQSASVALGDGIKRAQDVELQARGLVRRRIFAKKNLNPGDVFDRSNLMLARGNDGLGAEHLSNLLGAASPRTFTAGDPILW
jgi:sialic acid synthase SpsE